MATTDDTKKLSADEAATGETVKLAAPAQYIVLFPISPNEGALILPAKEGEPPVIVGDEIFASESDLTIEERAAILIEQGAILPVEAAKQLEAAKKKAKRLEEQAARALHGAQSGKAF